MKRFYDTCKWENCWFFDLPTPYKLLWDYVLSKCDNSGVWEANVALASQVFREHVTEEEALKLFGQRVIVIGDRKWWVPSLIRFQYGELKEGCKPHLQVINLLRRRGLYERYTKWLSEQSDEAPLFHDTLTEGYRKGSDTHKDKDKDKDKDQSPRARDLLFDTLAAIDGSDPTKLTSPAARACGVALAEIKAVHPDLTPDEIRRRAKNYPFDSITPSALAKHWARCNNSPNGKHDDRPARVVCFNDPKPAAA